MNRSERNAVDIPMPLGAHEAHVWYAWTEHCSTPLLLDRYRAMLSDDEGVRLSRFASDYLKAEYLLTRALCRVTLSRYAKVAPAEWIFRRNAYGRPEIATLGAPPNLRFNLSNARSLVACIVSKDCAVGIDVEEVNRSGETLSIADHFFSATELEGLRALPKAMQQQRFFDLWTLKESYIKARGRGLSIPLDQFSFVLHEPDIRVKFASSLSDMSADWQFELRHLSADHTMAISIHRKNLPNFIVSFREVVPQALLDE